MPAPRTPLVAALLLARQGFAWRASEAGGARGIAQSLAHASLDQGPEGPPQSGPNARPAPPPARDRPAASEALARGLHERRERESARAAGGRAARWDLSLGLKKADADMNETTTEDVPSEEELQEPTEAVCGVEPGEVVDCSCCGDLLFGQPLAEAALKFGGNVTLVNVYDGPPESGACSMGTARVWSLGSRLPTLHCDRGQITCRCEGPDWREVAQACAKGPACRPPGDGDGPAAEGPGGSAEGPGREELVTELGLGDAEQGGLCLENGQAEKLPFCEFRESAMTPAPETAEEEAKVVEAAMKDEEKGESSQNQSQAGSRFRLGATLCEDVSLEQCGDVYVRQGCAWHVCAVRRQTRVCHGRVSTAEELSEDADKAMLPWVTAQVRSPDAGWDFSVTKRGVAVDPEVPHGELRDGLAQIALAKTRVDPGA